MRKDNLSSILGRIDETQKDIRSVRDGAKI